MSFVQNFVCGAYVSRSVALKNLHRVQSKYSQKLKIVRVFSYDTYLYYVVY